MVFYPASRLRVVVHAFAPVADRRFIGIRLAMESDNFRSVGKGWLDDHV